MRLCLKQIEALEELAIAFPQYGDIIGEAMLNAQDEIDKVNEGLDEQVDKTKDLNDAWQELGPTFASAFEDAIVEGGNLRDVLSGLEKDIIRIITRNAITKPIGEGISSLFTSSGGGGISCRDIRQVCFGRCAVLLVGRLRRKGLSSR